jgi:hypothetical protein
MCKLSRRDLKFGLAKPFTARGHPPTPYTADRIEPSPPYMASAAFAAPGRILFFEMITEATAPKGTPSPR